MGFFCKCTGSFTLFLTTVSYEMWDFLCPLLFPSHAGQIGNLPSDAADQIASMQKVIDELSAQVSSVSLRVQTSIGHGNCGKEGCMWAGIT